MRFFLAVLLLCFTWGCVLQQSDEQVLRSVFQLSHNVKLLKLHASPKAEETGWFGREGLTIIATFKFNDHEFENYLNRVKGHQYWHDMPPSKEFIVDMTGIEHYKEALINSEKIIGNPLPEEGSPLNPTVDELYAQWKDKLPLDVEAGYYHCLTAGDNLLYAPKMPCENKTGYKNDFIFGALDRVEKKLHVYLHTSY